MQRRAFMLPRPPRPVATYDRADLLLVLAIDMSYSISPEDGRLQLEGYGAALRDARVLDAIAAGIHGAIGLAAVAWAGIGFQRVLVPWTWITERSDAEAWGRDLARAWEPTREEAAAEAFPNGAATCISRGIDFAAAMLDAAPWGSWRRVIDVSGDGPNNEGPPVEEARDRAVAEGITINGLAIEGDPEVARLLGPGATLTAYYRQSVTGGPGAFVVTAEDTRAFARAVRRKLILEISGRAPGDAASG